MSYNTEPLLSALDLVIESAHDRLNDNERQLLEAIRMDIVAANQDSIIEENFCKLVQFILMLYEYFDRFSK